MDKRKTRAILRALREIPDDLLEAPRSPLEKREVLQELDLNNVELPHAARRWSRKRLLVILEELNLVLDAEERHQLRGMLKKHSRRAARIAKERGHERFHMRLSLTELVQIALEAGCSFA